MHVFMCVCMQVWMLFCVYVCASVNTFMCMCVCISVCVYIHAFVCVCVCTCMYSCVCVCKCECICVCMCVQVWIHSCVCVCVCVCITVCVCTCMHSYVCVYVCQPSRVCGDSNWFRPKPRVHSLVGHLPQVSYVCLVGQSLRGRWWGWWWNGGGHQGQCNRFPGICLTTEENPGKLQLGNRRGQIVALPVITSNGVPSLQMKSVGSRYLLL